MILSEKPTHLRAHLQKLTYIPHNRLIAMPYVEYWCAFEEHEGYYPNHHRERMHILRMSIYERPDLFCFTIHYIGISSKISIVHFLEDS